MNRYPQWMNDGASYSYHDGTTTLEWTIFALLLLLVITLGAYIVMAVAGGRWSHTYVQSGAALLEDPLQVLRMRYARGETTREDFLERTADLTGAPPPPPPEAAG